MCKSKFNFEKFIKEFEEKKEQKREVDIELARKLFKDLKEKDNNNTN